MILVIYVDRDDDFGRKAGVSGPIIGRKAAEEAAIKLLKKDPRDTDANALFFALNLLNNFKDAEIVVLTGSADVGFESDFRIRKQLEEVLEKFKAKEAIFVSNGPEDEAVLPIIQSKLNIVSVYRFGIKESGRLKEMLYAVLDFLKRVRSSKREALFFFGIPGVLLLLYAILGQVAWRLFLGLLGFFLVSIGLKEYLTEVRPGTSLVFYSISALTLLAFARSIYIKPGLENIYQSLPLMLISAISAIFGIYGERREYLKIFKGTVSSFGLFLILRTLLRWFFDPTFQLSYLVIISTLILAVIIVVWQL